jgi:hypothetical protein
MKAPGEMGRAQGDTEDATNSSAPDPAPQVVDIAQARAEAMRRYLERVDRIILAQARARDYLDWCRRRRRCPHCGGRT